MNLKRLISNPIHQSNHEFEEIDIKTISTVYHKTNKKNILLELIIKKKIRKLFFKN